MKLDSELFDKVRVKPGADRTARAAGPRCEVAGCSEPGTHKAPKGRGREGQYHCFCLEHVRQYNKSYNYFAGMSDADVTDYVKAATFGHRPTWTMGVNSSGPGAADRGAFAFHDPFELFGDPHGGHGETHVPEARTVHNAERRSLDALNLDETATGPEIKTRFKALVKRFHPDLNGGDRSTEDRLREVIQAYSHLKAAGFC